MFPHHLCVKRFPVIWGEMLNGGVFSLQQESQNKMTNTSLKKNNKKTAAVFASDIEANRIQSGSWDFSAVKIGALAASVAGRRIFPELHFRR